jgi:hypothetical protein
MNTLHPRVKIFNVTVLKRRQSSLRFGWISGANDFQQFQRRTQFHWVFRFDSFLRFLPLAVSHIVSHLDTRLRHRASVSEPKPKKAAEGTFAHFALFVQGVFALFDQGEIVAHAWYSWVVVTTCIVLSLRAALYLMNEFLERRHPTAEVRN